VVVTAVSTQQARLAAASIVEHVAGVDDFEVAEAAYRAAVVRWPAARITLRQDARIVHESKNPAGAGLVGI
jgi:hypothetical protein